MLPRDSAVVGYMAALYAAAPQGFAVATTTSGVAWGLVRLAGADIVILRGSQSVHDWLDDFDSEAGRTVPGFRQLGLLPCGFSEGIADAYAAIKAALRPDPAIDCVFAGHSLGAARAAELAAMHRSAGGHVDRIVLCGCPRPGTAALRQALDGLPIANYRNRRDFVCDVPEPLVPLWLWAQMAPFTPLDEAPVADGSIDPDHNIALYLAGVKRLEGAGAVAGA